MFSSSILEYFERKYASTGINVHRSGFLTICSYNPIDEPFRDSNKDKEDSVKKGVKK